MENSEIEWTDHTFNPWIGCTKVSDGCKHCYAESLEKRFNKAKWGPTAQRVRTSESYWQKLAAWNKRAWFQCAECGYRFPFDGKLDICKKCGEALFRPVRQRVFCASLADIFEDNPQVEPWRVELFKMFCLFTNLDFLLLTKRIENANDMVPAEWRTVGGWPANVWIGTTVENQAMADQRIPELLNVPAAVRFLSCEPLLGHIDLSGRTVDGVWIDPEYATLDPGLSEIVEDEGWPIHWVIAGGESGPHARPMQPSWARALRNQCTAAGVPFLFKQWGQWGPKPDYMQGAPMIKRSKFANGRELDGRTWDEYPEVTRG